MSDPAVPVDLRRKALVVLFWFIALSLLFNSLFGDMGLIQGYRQRRLLARLQGEVLTLRMANDRLAGDIDDLKHDPYRIEQIAREELGLGRPGEILFLFEDTGPRPGAPPMQR
ncbi:MAG: septum formation initiator family protein [Acidobacteria bacterium]|nr:septum formation initiator family protein [Acidobacteriota bacterium]